jgi:type VI secretion system protein ImpA
MAPLDHAQSLPDISEVEPAGPNLEFDPDFIELERLVQGKPEQQYGSLVVPAEEPDWKAALATGKQLLQRTYDLRVMAHMAVARLHVEGVSGFAAGLGLCRQVLQTRWNLAHPQLDPDDDNDPTLRSNALLRMAEPAWVLRTLRNLPLARSIRAGAVTWRDIAAGTIEPEPDKERVSETTIVAAFRETDQVALSQLREAVASAIAEVTAIPTIFDNEAGYGTGPDYTELAKLLAEIGRAIEKFTPVDTQAAVDELADDTVPTPDNPQPVARATAALSIASLAPVTNRADAVRLLELVIDYYVQNEPSSPLPLLIGRARRLADKNFMELLRDLAPEGISQVEVIAGRSEDTA